MPRRIRRALAKGLTETIRDWTAGLGLVGSLIGTGSVLAEGLHRTAPGIICLAMGLTGFVCSLLALRDHSRRSWLLALSSLTLTIALFVILNTTPR